MNKAKIISYVHAVLCILLGIFFINAGIKKYIPRDLRPVDAAVLHEQVIEQGSYAPPLGYNLTMNTMRQSGFLKFVGIFQLAAGLLLLIPKSRFVGLLLLLPIIFNIFFMHVFFDNRPHENIETGIPFVLTILLTLYYKNTILHGVKNAYKEH